MELFCENRQRSYHVDYFRKKTLMFGLIPNALPIGGTVNVGCR